MTKFYYGDYVEITVGFYTGSKAKIRGTRTRWFGERTYVLVNDLLYLNVLESHLKLVQRGNLTYDEISAVNQRD